MMKACSLKNNRFCVKVSPSLLLAVRLIEHAVKMRRCDVGTSLYTYHKSVFIGLLSGSARSESGANKQKP